MCDGPNTYQADFPNGNGTTLQIESERLNLVIEVDSDVGGETGFQESMYFVFGKERFYEVVSNKEYWYDEDEFSSIEEFNKRYKLNVNQKDLDHNDGYYYIREIEKSRGVSPSKSSKPEDEFI